MKSYIPRYVIFKRILVTDGWGSSCEIALKRISLDFTDDQSTLVQVMAWCRQATSHYLSQCWPRSMTPSGITRPQWVNHQRNPGYHYYIIHQCVYMAKFCISSIHQVTLKFGKFGNENKNSYKHHFFLIRYNGRALSSNPGLQYPLCMVQCTHLINRWDTPLV